MKNIFKKLISSFLVAVICLMSVPAISFDSFAANGVTMRLEKLKKDFPSGYYYNHKVTSSDNTRLSLLEMRDESYAYAVSKKPCNDHSATTGKGGYDCNYFDGGYQCHGFAAMLFYEIFGVRQSSLKKNYSDPYSIRPGDLVRIKGDTHSAVVVSVKGDKFTVAECNVAENGGDASCKIKWGRSCNIADITYYITAGNYAEISADTNWKHIEDKQSAGSSFYAAIYNTEKNKALTLTSDNNVVLKSYSGASSQVWKFTKQKNGSYKIVSCKNGRALEVVGSVKSGKANVVAAKSDSGKNQLWAFYKSGSSFYLSADCGVSVLTAESSGNICVDKKSASKLKLFEIKKKKTPEKSTISAKGSEGYAKLSWTKGDYTKTFDIEIYKNGSELYKKYTGLKDTSLKVTLPAGTYYAKVISRNAYSKTTGSTAHFTVSKKGVLGKTAKVTATQTTSSINLSWAAVPGADGYAILYKTGDEWKLHGSVLNTSYSITGLSAGKKYTLAVCAFKRVDCKITLAKEQAIFTVATKMKAPSKLSATQTTTTVKLSWSELSAADGYRVYKKTSSGWEDCGATEKTAKTVKGLTAGKNYTFAVRGYIKTSLGTVWGVEKIITTATKPKAPTVSVSGVKNLKATIRWNKVSGADGYRVYYKLDSSDSYTKLGDYGKNEGGVELSRLTAGVYYTFAVRAYKEVDGKRIYGDTSTVRFRAKLF